MHDIKTKLRRCASEFPTEQDRIDYVASQVAMPARDHIRMQLDADSLHPFTTAEEVLATLDRALGKSKLIKQQEAKEEYRKLYQKDRPFTEF